MAGKCGVDNTDVVARLNRDVFVEMGNPLKEGTTVTITSENRPTENGDCFVTVRTDNGKYYSIPASAVKLLMHSSGLPEASTIHSKIKYSHRMFKDYDPPVGALIVNIEADPIIKNLRKGIENFCGNAGKEECRKKLKAALTTDTKAFDALSEALKKGTKKAE